jgi:hypothetical protein
METKPVRAPNPAPACNWGRVSLFLDKRQLVKLPNNVSKRENTVSKNYGTANFFKKNAELFYLRKLHTKSAQLATCQPVIFRIKFDSAIECGGFSRFLLEHIKGEELG